ncbi:MAG: hypothetical protein RIT81_16465 [Deltaproteobacteria bacterium]
MSVLLKGALIEYASDFFGPIPNIVLFQFNPEELSRNIQIPPRSTRPTSRETNQSGDPPVEVVSFTAHFDAADYLAEDNPLTRATGVGPQLAALEKMVHPKGAIGTALTELVDAVGASVGGAGDEGTRNVPRRPLPRVLFVWGVYRVLPVSIRSMSITEKAFDFLLNPIRAEVALELAIMEPDPCADDPVGKGAWAYSSAVKEAQAMTNLANTVLEAIDIFEF